MIHVAVLKPKYIDLILAGEKTIESRFARVRALPIGRIAPGHAIYLKDSGGPVRATAIASRVWNFENLWPKQIDMLKRRFEHRVRAGSDYWRQHRHANHACFIELGQLEPIFDPPIVPRLFGSGWLILPVTARAMRRSA